MTQTVAYVNSWPDWAGGGLQHMGYTPAMDRFANHGAWVKWLTVVTPPAPEAYTARLRVATVAGRKYLTIRVGVVGEAALTVWDRNGQVNMVDDRKTLAIDVPLPAYATQHWPPRRQHVWYVEVTDSGGTTGAGPAATVEEVTLVRRIHDGPDGRLLEKYSPYMDEHAFEVPRGGTATLYLPLPAQPPPAPGLHRATVRFACPPLPACPTCPMFDAAPLEEIARGPGRPVLVELYRAGKHLARLGRVTERLVPEWRGGAAGRRDRAVVRVKLEPADYASLSKARAVDAEVRLVDPWDRVVIQSHLVRLERVEEWR